MAGFIPSSSFGKETYVKEFYIATDTAIEKGEIVLQTPGTGIAAVAGTEFNDPMLGVSLQEHDGSSDGQTGTTLKVACNPNEIFALKSSEAQTLTGGSTTTAVISGLLPQTDDLWIGGYIEVVSSANGLDKGDLIPITDSTGSSGTLTIPTQSAAFASGDTIIIHPGKLAIGEYGWDLNSDGTDIDYTSNGGEGLVLVDTDAKNRLAFFKPRLHQFGNDAAAK